MQYSGLVLKDVDRIIKFNQEAWLKPYIDMNTKLRTEAKNEFEKAFLWFDTSNYNKIDIRPLLIDKNKKVTGMFKDELEGKIMKEFRAPRTKTYAYLKDDDIENKKGKGTKNSIIKRRRKLKGYKDSVFENITILRSHLRFKSDLHNV